MRTKLGNTTAMVLAASAVGVAAYGTGAEAAEWDVRVGGYMEQYVAYSSVDDPATAPGDFDGVDTAQDAEIWFLPSITLDNGIKIGANIQLEGNTSGDTIDESYMFIKGAFGEILLGSENSAGYKMTYAAPDVTFVNVNSGSLTFFVPFSGTIGGVGLGSDVFRRTLGTSYIENLGNINNDAQRITYFTPRFAGLQVGVSYARDSLQDSSAQVDCNTTTCDFFDVGANYVNSFGGIDIALSGRYGIADANAGPNPDVWSVGGNLGFMGFTVGGSYAEQNDAGVLNGEFWDVGISYETGPWGFSVTFADGQNVDNEQPTTDEELQQLLFGVKYALAKGVTLNGFVAYVDFDEKLTDGGAPGGDDLDAWVVGTGIKISF